MEDYLIRDIRNMSDETNFPEIPVSDIGTVIVNIRQGGFYIYDFINDTIIGLYKNDNNEGDGIKISTNGDYVFLKDDSLRMVQFTNGEFKKIYSQSFSKYEFYEFYATNPNFVVFWDGSTFYVNLCNSMLNVREFILTDDIILNIDYYSGQILTYKPGHLYIRSYLDGSLLKDIPVNIDPTDWSNACCLINNTIVSRGVLYFINQD
jgi:hypothetical protein